MPTDGLHWYSEDQIGRLDELTSSDPRTKDLPLRRDVRSLGFLLGTVIREQQGDEAFAVEEKLRRLSIRHRELENSLDTGQAGGAAEAVLLQEAADIIAGLSETEAHHIVKAFATFFELTNLAETRHRIRRGRAHRVSRAPVKPGTFKATLQRMKDAGLTLEETLDQLRRIEIVPVFTAHPTEVARRVVLFKRRRIAAELAKLDQLPLSAVDAAAVQQAILAEITALWQADEVRRKQPTVRDEIIMGLDHYSASLFPPIAPLYEKLTRHLNEVFDADLEAARLPALLRFGSWIGGDRDGNPYVTPASTREALSLAREKILSRYLDVLEQLRQLLTSSGNRVGIQAPLQEALENYRTAFPEAMAEIDSLPEGELNRRLLTLMRHRLQRTLAEPGDAEAYPNAAAFAADLDLLNASLRACRGERLARQLVEPLRRELAAFGFHLHSLDIRQHARAHAQALAELAVGAAHAAQPEGPRSALGTDRATS
ncbi:MAG: phosphoenolpyruvate carboxylase [Trichloromonas sp.]|jgi:phosphoenolpyruvate carboxylase|nr:phosphoenolpyruvate carboxylase [Trichloromonas sp.]